MTRSNTAALILLFFLCGTTSAQEKIDIYSAADITAKRDSMISYIWGGAGWPTRRTPDTIYSAVYNPYYHRTSAYKAYLTTIDEYRILLPNGFISDIYHFHAKNPNGKLFIYHSGHTGEGGGFDDEDYASNNLRQYPGLVVRALLSQGYDVLGISMPLNDKKPNPYFFIPQLDSSFKFVLHDQMFQYLKNPYIYFLEPIVVALNYVEDHYSYSEIDMTGLSGGGWTTTVYSALDPRITKSYPVAGSVPLFARIGYEGLGDAEQGYGYTGLYAIANYSELYVMGAYGSGRVQTQILNRFDNSVFWGQRQASWVDTVKATINLLGSGRYDFYSDEENYTHRISPWAVSVIFGSMQDSIPTMPGLFMPANDSLVSTRNINLDWFQSIRGDSYTLQISKDSTFQRILITDSAITPTLTSKIIPTLLPLTHYFWRVKARNSRGESPWSPSYSFTTMSDYQSHDPIISTPVFTAHEDTLYQYQVIAQDPDTSVGIVLSYALTQKPSWLSISASGLISGIPRGANVGDSTVTIQVTDGYGGIITQSYNLNVVHTNHAPVFISQIDSIANEDSLYMYTAHATDQDSALFGDRVHYRLSIKPGWLIIDSVTGILSGLPSGMNARDTIVAIRACDNKGGIMTQQFTLHVAHVNHPPRILSQSITSGHEDSLYQYRVCATDPDSALYGDRINYTLVIHPFWMTIDSVKGIVTGTPHAMSVGDTVVTVQVSDGKGGIAIQSYPLTITHTNHSPIFMQLPDTVAKEDTLYQSKVWATDQDSALFGDRVHYKLLNKPGWITIDSLAGKLSGTPIGASALDTTLNVQAYDGKGGVVSKQTVLHVIRVNHPPVIFSTALATVFEDSTYKYRAGAADQDTVVGDSISYVVIAHPSWLIFNPATHCFSGTPRGVNVGDTLFSFRVMDKSGATANQIDTLHVIHTNHVPQFAGVVIDTIVVEDQSYKDTVWAIDRDSAIFGDRVHYRLLKPAWLTIDSSTGIFGGTPHVQNVFDTVAVLQAYDNHGGISQQQYALHITQVNHPPTLASSPVFTAHEDTLYQYQVVAHDPDTLIGQVLSYTLTQKPSWLSVSASGLVSGIPRGANVGDSTVTIRVSDGYGGIVNQTYRLNVIHTNHNPYFVSAPDSVVTEDSSYLYTAVARDQDSALFGDRVHYKLIIKPSWITIDSVAGTLTGVSSGMNARDTVIGIQAFDNNGGGSTQQFILHVLHVNHAPQFVSFPADSAVEDSLYYTMAAATDQDSLLWGDKDNFGILQGPSWLAIDSVKGIMQGIPKLEGNSSSTTSLAVQVANAKVKQILSKAKGIKFYTMKQKVKPVQITGIKTDNTTRDFPVTIAVWDDKGGASEYSFALTVKHTNHAPVFVTFPDSAAIEDSAYTATVRASDIDSAQFGDVVRYRCASKPHWISIDSLAGIVSGTPHGTDVMDSTRIIVQAYDNKGGVTTYQYGVHTRHMNHPPVFVSAPVVSGVEDSSYMYRVHASDSDSLLFGDKVYYSFITAPNFLSIDSSSGIIGGIPSLVVDSLSMRSVRVTAGKQSRTAVMRSSVVKFIPAISRSGKKSTAGAHGEIDSTQYRTFPVSISARDGKGGSAQQNYTLAILHTDHSPVFTSTPDSLAIEDSIYSSTYTLYDRDVSVFGDSLNVTATILPAWLHHDPVQHTLSGIPYGKSAADTVVELVVHDNRGLSTTQHYKLHVVNINHPPLILPVLDTLARADSVYRVVIPAIDSDAVYGRDSLTYKLVAGPHWLRLVNDTLVGIPVNANAGDSVVTVAVIDKHGITVQQSWKIVILPLSLPPTMFQLINASHSDSLTIDYGKALTLAWQPSHGHDPGDTVHYALKLWGGAVDTTITGLNDTLYSSSGLMKKLSVRTQYRWTVSANVDGGKSTWSRDTMRFVTTETILFLKGQTPQVPKDYVVYQNYPNPFNPTTTIRYGIPEQSRVSIKVYNILGQLVATLVNEIQQPQFYEYRWNPQDFASGVYLIVINAESTLSSARKFQNVKKALYLK